MKVYIAVITFSEQSWEGEFTWQEHYLFETDTARETAVTELENHNPAFLRALLTEARCLTDAAAAEQFVVAAG